MYYYKHINGKVIEKPDRVVIDPGEYFDSPNVLAWYHKDDITGVIDKSWPKPTYNFSDWIQDMEKK